MAIHHHRPTAIVRRPVVAHRQAVLIGFAGGLAVQGEFPHLARTPPVHLLAQARVGDHQPAAIEHIMADQSIQKLQRLGAKGVRFAAQLLQRFGQAVADLHLSAAQGPDQLEIVITDHAIAIAAVHRRHGQPQYVRRPGAAIHQIADKDQLPALGMRDPPRFLAGIELIAELIEQPAQFIKTTVYVADDVEGTGFSLFVVPQRLPLDIDCIYLLHRIQPVDVTEAFALQAAQGTAQTADLIADHVRAKIPVGAAGVTLPAGPLRQIEHDSHRQAVILAGQLHQRLAILQAHIGGVHHRQPTTLEPLAGDVVQDVEGVRRGRLIILVIGHQPSTVIRGDHFSWAEVAAGEGGFTAAGSAHQHHQRQFRQRDFHASPPSPLVREGWGGGAEGLPSLRTNTAIWVGAPTAASTSPTGTKRTA